MWFKPILTKGLSSNFTGILDFGRWSNKIREKYFGLLLQFKEELILFWS